MERVPFGTQRSNSEASEAPKGYPQLDRFIVLFGHCRLQEQCVAPSVETGSNLGV